MGLLVDPMLIVDVICWGGMFARVCRLVALLFNQPQTRSTWQPRWMGSPSINHAQPVLSSGGPPIYTGMCSHFG